MVLVVPVMTGHSSLWVSLTSLARLGRGPTSNYITPGGAPREPSTFSQGPFFNGNTSPIVRTFPCLTEDCTQSLPLLYTLDLVRQPYLLMPTNFCWKDRCHEFQSAKKPAKADESSDSLSQLSPPKAEGALYAYSVTSHY